MKRHTISLFACLILLISFFALNIYADNNDEQIRFKLASERLTSVYGDNISLDAYKVALNETMKLITIDSIEVANTPNTEEVEDAALSQFCKNRSQIYQFLVSQDDVTWKPDDSTAQKNVTYLISHYSDAMSYGVTKEVINEYIAGVEAGAQIVMDEGGLVRGPVDPNPALTQRMNAIDYALGYALSPNPAYPYWGANADCANFISQCIFAGGKAMQGSPATSNCWDTTKWYSYGTVASTNYVSVSWCGAAEFYQHWHNRAVSYRQFSSAQMANGGAAYTYAQPGDAVSLLYSDGTPYHTMIVVSKTSSGVVYLAAHSGATTNATLSGKASSALGGCIIYNIFGN